ncbi:MAG TPA: ABC transporter ATP-binding protein [Gemmatimonadaceae bacterium]|nr:ABC transporter ATP-binding protein [Gemmatimonadaceae bacterium]
MSAIAIYKRLLRFARPYWGHILGLFAVSLAATPLTLLAPLPMKIVVDSALGGRAAPAFLTALLPATNMATPSAILALAIVLLLIVGLLSNVQRVATGLLTTFVSERLVLGFRSELFRRMQRLSLAYHDMTGSSDSLYRIQYDAMAIQFIAIDGTIPFVVSLTTLVAMVFVIAKLDPTLALIAVAIMPLIVMILRYFRPRLYLEWKRVKKLESSAMSVVQEVLGAVRVVKAFGQEDREHNRFTRHSGEGLDAKMRVGYVAGLMGALTGVTIAIGTALVLFVGAEHVRQGTLTLGSLLLVMGYIASLYAPIETIAARIGVLQSHLVSAERAFVLMDELPDVVDRPGARPLDRARGAVRVESVSFAYEANQSVLDGISFEVAQGQCVGVVGRTGAGKTTLINLLLRFYDPGKGRILLDGVDIRDYKLADLRNQYSIVLQDAVLFSTSIRENIAYAKPDASDDEIVAAARAANAHDFIERLSDGYETLVGERGLRLSGGERQRISLARAFLKNAPLLVLDEPTSAVDVGTEAGIMDAMQRLMEGRTTFLITHRPSTLQYADLVLSVQSGRVVVGGPSLTEARDPAKVAVGTIA